MNLVAIAELLPGICKVWRWVSRRKPKALPFLIVEDNPDDAETLRLVLRKRGIECEIATSGEMARGLVKHSRYPLILLDMRLPEMSGEALVRCFSADLPSAGIVVVCGEPSDLATMPASRFICLIRKPATLEAIEEMLSRIKI